MDIVTTHKNTDFDGLASMIAATLLYADTVAVCPGHVNANVQRFLSLHKTSVPMVLAREVDPEAVRRLIVVDTSHWSRLEHRLQLGGKAGVEIILWDHHLPPGDIMATEEHVEQVGATVSLLVDALQKRQVQLSPLQATLFLLGIYEDTGQLTFNSTTPLDARAAAFLLEQGADLNIVVDFLNIAYGEEQKRVLFQLMHRGVLHEIRGKRVFLAVVDVRKYVELAMVVQLYGKIVNAEAVFAVLVNEGGDVFIIGRSSTPEIDVRVILQPFGGGGHPGAGSATLHAGEAHVDTICQQILESLQEAQPGGPRVADMMSFPVTMVAPDTPMTEIQRIMEEERIRGVVVAEAGRLQGIVVLWDLKKLRYEKQWSSPVKAFMTRDVLTITPAAQASAAAELMVRKDVGHLPVVQEDKVIGIVTRTDVINYLYGMLPS